MPDWTKPMNQTFEYYVVDPETWGDTERLTNITSSSIDRDSEAETRGSGSFEVTDLVGECYIRTYMVVSQNGKTEKIPLATLLSQTPKSTFDGMKRDVSVDAYTPLIELKEKQPPLGYFIPKDANVMDSAYRLTEENLRAPVVKPVNVTKNSSDFIADPNDTWLSYLSDFISNHVYDNDKDKATVTKYSYDLDEMGRVLFVPEQDVEAMNPVWTYDDGNSSILHPSISMEHDLYGIPNVVEVVYSKNGLNYSTRVSNDDPNSPISTVTRGREITYRVIDPDLAGALTSATVKKYIDEYATQLLKSMSTIEYSISYTHGYCPVRVGDCVMLNYKRAGLTGIKAKVVSQSIKCEPGCPVTERAIFTAKLWR